MTSRATAPNGGLTDWYEEVEEQILDALKQGPGFEWTTGWYASKKEIASGQVTCRGGQIYCEASVSDDFDTEGSGSVTIPWSPEIEDIKEALGAAWQNAEYNQKDNRLYYGFKVLHNGSWVESYLAPMGDGHYMDAPPGDYYHQWGWQEDDELPPHVKAAMQQWLDDGGPEDKFEIDGWVIQPWED